MRPQKSMPPRMKRSQFRNKNAGNRSDESHFMQLRTFQWTSIAALFVVRRLIFCKKEHLEAVKRPFVPCFGLFPGLFGAYFSVCFATLFDVLSARIISFNCADLPHLTHFSLFATLGVAAGSAQCWILSRAEVAELADAHGSGPCTRKGVGVRVPSSAPSL